MQWRARLVLPRHFAENYAKFLRHDLDASVATWV
jgi:hypothetical protein